MALPAAYAPLSASMIMGEADQPAGARAALVNNSTAIPLANSMTKLYENASPSGVNQTAPFAYSEFYSKSIGSLIAFMGVVGTSATICGDDTLTFLWHDGTASKPQTGDKIFNDSSGGSNIVANRYVGWDDIAGLGGTVNRIGQTDSSGVLGFTNDCPP